MPGRFGSYLPISFLFVLLAACVSPAPVSTPIPTSTPLPPPVEGSPGMGDPYYPNLGNSGYDVQNYEIVLDVDPLMNNIQGSTEIMATATERLGSFHLDFHGLMIESINVNGEIAEYSRNEDELTIKPSMILELNEPFKVVVQYKGTPDFALSIPMGNKMGWSHAESGAINIWGEPDAASNWFPNNNHPRDKATFLFEITVPKPWVVAANGKLKETKEDGEKTLFIWEMDKPMATYLATVNIDQYETFTQNGPNGVSIRSYFPTEYPLASRLNYNILPSAINFFNNLFGPYPFDEYGVVVASEDGLCKDVNIALEAQTMTIHCPVMNFEEVIVHELAHQWFGDSVSLENWKDIWLKEGFATYAQWLWASKNDPEALSRITKNRDAMFFDTDFPVAEPSPDNLYTNDSYTGGALVLNALRLKIGDENFFNLLRAYTEKYQYGNAGTDEFIALAEEISRQELKEFFDQWIYGKRIPDLPKQ